MPANQMPLSTEEQEHYFELLKRLEGATIKRVILDYPEEDEPPEYPDEVYRRTMPVSLTITMKDGSTYFVTPRTKPEGHEGSEPAWLAFGLPF